MLCELHVTVMVCELVSRCGAEMVKDACWVAGCSVHRSEAGFRRF